ncbi:hypothetical protein J2R98_000083 [Alkalibacillus filiformis]|uniref:Lipoprotein n=1 Tax=Alkalibacillus filiformis TaxID=200990 RepID=A0ABU0DPB7_9BACI|nr:lipoprotein [Alkalibacillus filiformis]MDQ0350280.1 hypothetical protein [Alkalibacillus filiformis]
MKKVLLLFVLLFILSACNGNGSTDYSDYDKELSEKAGYDVHIIEPNDLTLTAANITTDDEVGLHFSQVDGELQSGSVEDERGDDVEYVYGPYVGDSKYRVIIQPKPNEFQLEEYKSDEMDIHEINGHDVAYEINDMPPEGFFGIISLEELVIHVNIQGDADEIEDEAFDYIEKLIDAYGN